MIVQGRMFYFEAAKAAKEKGKLTPEYKRICLKNYARMAKKEGMVKEPYPTEITTIR